MLIDSRKFVIRAHVLLLQASPSSSRSDSGVFLHSQCIVMPHASPYYSTEGAGDCLHPSGKEAAHVSSKGKARAPFLLDSVFPDLHAHAFQQMQKIVHKVHHDCVEEHVGFLERKFDSNGGYGQDDRRPRIRHYHLLGYDFMVDADGTVWLLEINANPAIASGTLAKAPKHIFHRLMMDTLGLLFTSPSALNSGAKLRKCGKARSREASHYR